MVFEKNHFLRGASPRFEKTGSHTLPHIHALLAKRTWRSLTQLLCAVRKGPARPNYTCLQGKKVFLHSPTDKVLLESHSKGATRIPIEWAKSLIGQVCLKETFCGAKTVETAAAWVQWKKKKSVGRLYGMMFLPLSARLSTSSTIDQKSIFYINFSFSKCKV